jgi:hypothetical protein
LSYTVKEKSGLFEIVERATDLVVVSRNNMVEATRLAKSLNRGSGFDGYTPTFFSLTYPDHVKENAVQN